MIALIFPAAALLGKDFGFFTRDPTQIGSIPFYAGYLSSLGVLCWALSTTVALFTSSVLNSLAADRAKTMFLLYFGSLTALLTLDDLFLIHETLPINEKAVFLAYLLIAAAGLVIFRKQFTHYPAGYAIAAAVLFAVSLAIDRKQSSIESAIGGFRILLEDGAKFSGVVCWAIFLCRTSAAAILENVRR